MNQKVLEAQQWLNANYTGRTGYVRITEDGVTGSNTLMALVRAVQIELGNGMSVTGTFGDQTKAAFPTLSNDNSTVFVRIIQHGLFCKGYDPGQVNGTYGTSTINAVRNIQQDAGLSGSQVSDHTDGKVAQAVLSTEYYVKVSGGDNKIRDIQRDLNGKYVDYIGLRPCDGILGRDTVKALIYALQAEEGIPVGTANGNFGPATKTSCPSIPYDGNEQNYTGVAYSNEKITRMKILIQYCLYCQGFSRGNKYNPGNYNGDFSTTVNAIKAFQADVGLADTGYIGLNEWMALMVSTGNPDRPVQALDCATRLTKDQAIELSQAGYHVVGRYLTGDYVSNNTRIAKNLLRSEIQDIFDAGLRLFVIFQDHREYLQAPGNVTIFDYFKEDQGYHDARKAFSVAKTLGVPRQEIIYFAVDYDFTEPQVESRIIPYFQGIHRYMRQASNYRYRIGIYSARRTCTLVSEAGLSESSFVSDMSTGYSGNLGHPLPEDWAFDQIKEFTFSRNGQSFPIDNDVLSGRYVGFSREGVEAITDDDEWDLHTSGGDAKVLLTSSEPIPLYWAKVFDPDPGAKYDEKFVAKYPMFDDIQPGAFFTMKRHSVPAVNEVRNYDDCIYYVYFRDVGGRLNAGYAQFKNFDHFNPFPLTYVFRNETGHTEVVAADASEGEHWMEFELTQPLRYRRNNGAEYVWPFPVGTKVELPLTREIKIYDNGNSAIIDSPTAGARYPNMISFRRFQLPGGDWRFLVDSNEAGNPEGGYVDMGFEYGVLPQNRVLISGTENDLIPREQLMGDVNMDGVVDVADAILLMQYLAGSANLSEAQLALADVNGDGKVNIGDVTIIMQMTIG